MSFFIRYYDLMLSFYLPFIKKLIGIGKKIVLVITVFAIVIALFSHFLRQDKIKITHDPVKENRSEIYKIVNDPELNKTSQGKTALATFRIISCVLVGEACTNNPNDGDTNFNRSAFGSLSKMLVLPMVNPPASGVMWVFDGLQNAGFIPKTYAAQGIGFGALQPFAKIWVAFRDLAYVFLVLVIIAIGFMVMFRMKLNPQTVIGVENALPRIVISLILITFSFAIAGFLIDLMYISISIIIAILQPAGGYNLIQYQQKYILAGPNEIFTGIARTDSFWFFDIFFYLPSALLDIIPIIGGIFRTLAGFLAVFWIGPVLATKWGWMKTIITGIIGPEVIGKGGIVIAEAGATWNVKELLNDLLHAPWNLLWIGIAISFVGTVLLPLVIGVLIFATLIFIFFRIFFMLITTYAKILLSVIISPLLLLFEAIPGQSAFTNWLKSLTAELITFPTVIAIFILGTIIINQMQSGPMAQFPFLIGIDSKSFGYLVGMLLLFMTPDLVKAVKQFIVPKPGIIDSLVGGLGVGAFFAGATTGLSAGMGEVSKYGGLAYYFKPMAPLLKRFGLDKILNTGGPPPH